MLARLDFSLYATRFSEIRVWRFLFGGGSCLGFFFFLDGCTEGRKKKLKTFFYSSRPNTYFFLNFWGLATDFLFSIFVLFWFWAGSAGWGWGGIICALFSIFFFLAIASFFWLNLATWLFSEMCIFPLVITFRNFL